MDIRDIINTQYPIIQGGMANIATGEFAAAISNAGGPGPYRRRRHEAGGAQSEHRHRQRAHR